MFLTRDGKAKLGDLNVSKIAKKGLLYTQTGTPYYASPEVWRDLPYDAKSDIWSLGCVVYEAAALQPPFTATSMQALNQCVQRGDIVWIVGVYPCVPPCYSEELGGIVKALIRVNPKARPSCEEILLMPSVRRKVLELGLLEDDCVDCLAGNELLGTIQVPKNLRILRDKLPKPHYQNNTQDKEESVPAFGQLARRNRSTKDNSRLVESGNSVIRSRYLNDYSLKNAVRVSQQCSLNLSTADSAKKEPVREAAPEMRLPDIRRGVAPIKRLPPRVYYNRERGGVENGHYQPRHVEAERAYDRRLQRVYEEVDRKRGNKYPLVVHDEPTIPNAYRNQSQVHRRPIVVQPSWWG